jgi:hypothetical protein
MASIGSTAAAQRADGSHVSSATGSAAGDVLDVDY